MGRTRRTTARRELPPDDFWMTRPSESEATRATRSVERIRRGREAARLRIEALEALRPRSRPVDLLFQIVERDREIYAGTMAGALAFRFFLFLVPLTLVLVVVLGVFISGDAGSAQGLTDRFGLRGALAEALTDAADQGRPNRWWALAIGVLGAGWAAIGCVRSIRLVHFLAWNRQPQRITRLGQAIGLFVAANIVVLGSPLLAGWARAVAGVFGDIAGVVGVFFVYGALWVAISRLLPPHDVPWRFLVPGAVVFAFGVHVLHLVTAYVFAPRLERATSVYGAVGVAAVLLAWLFLVARLVVASAVVNAVLAENRGRARAGRRDRAARLESSDSRGSDR